MYEPFARRDRKSGPCRDVAVVGRWLLVEVRPYDNLPKSFSLSLCVQLWNSSHVSFCWLSSMTRHDIGGGYFLCKWEIYLGMNYTSGTLGARGIFLKVHENAALVSKVPRTKKWHFRWHFSNPLMARGLLIMVLKLLMTSFSICLS